MGTDNNNLLLVKMLAMYNGAQAEAGLKRTGEIASKYAKEQKKDMQDLMRFSALKAKREAYAQKQNEIAHKKRVAYLKKEQAIRDQANKSFLGKLSALNTMLLSVGMTMLFGGMAIKNFFQNIARGLINNFAIMTGEQSAFSASLNRLKGSVAFLGFTLMDALVSSGIWDMAIDGITRFTGWLADAPEWLKTLSVLGIFAGVAVGGAMMFAGQGVMLLNGLVSLLVGAIQIFGASAVVAFGASVIGAIGRVATAIWGVFVAALPIIGVIALWVVAILSAIVVFKSVKAIFSNIIDGIAIKWKLLVGGMKEVFLGMGVSIVTYFKDHIISAMETAIAIYNGAASIFGFGMITLDAGAAVDTAIENMRATQKELIRENAALANAGMDNYSDAIAKLKQEWDPTLTTIKDTVGKFTNKTSPEDMGAKDPVYSSGNTQPTHVTNYLQLPNGLQYSFDSANFTGFIRDVEVQTGIDLGSTLD